MRGARAAEIPVLRARTLSNTPVWKPRARQHVEVMARTTECRTLNTRGQCVTKGGHSREGVSAGK